MWIMFPADSVNPKRIDTIYSGEQKAAKAAGFQTGLINLERLESSIPAGDWLRLPTSPARNENVLYRGWMIRPTAYIALVSGWAAAGLNAITTPSAYQRCHYLPEYYSLIANHTPRSIWVPVSGPPNFRSIFQLLEPFGTSPIIVKDFVKSQKHYWNEACFIPHADDHTQVERVVRRFMDLQGTAFNVGLVFREFLPIKRVGNHPQSGMPMSLEYRIFFGDGQPLTAARYWSEATYTVQPPIDLFSAIATTLDSRFFSMDVAQLESGTWVIMEIGDGQVSGLNGTISAADFYSSLAKLWLKDQARG